jgi:hypothetical protein
LRLALDDQRAAAAAETDDQPLGTAPTRAPTARVRRLLGPPSGRGGPGILGSCQLDRSTGARPRIVRASSGRCADKASCGRPSSRARRTAWTCCPATTICWPLISCSAISAD